MKLSSTEPRVATFADHEVIRPVNTLTKALKGSGRGLIDDDDAIARAEAALAGLAGEFAGWMRAECDRLDFARLRIRDLGLVKAGPEELFRAAHDIKGQAATFGYPAAARTAESLCRLLEHTPDLSRIPVSLIDQHVDGVRAIIREDTRQHETTLAASLAQSLRAAADDFLLQENRDRPAYVDAIMGPPLAPKA
jgi:HPt (histidine-containing phosphotransfer) domain-containing protein